MDRGAWRGAVGGITESDMTEGIWQACMQGGFRGTPPSL